MNADGKWRENSPRKTVEWEFVGVLTGKVSKCAGSSSQMLDHKMAVSTQNQAGRRGNHEFAALGWPLGLG